MQLLLYDHGGKQEVEEEVEWKEQKVLDVIPAAAAKRIVCAGFNTGMELFRI